MAHAGADHGIEHHRAEVALESQELLAGQALQRDAGHACQGMALGQRDDERVPVGRLVGEGGRQQG